MAVDERRRHELHEVAKRNWGEEPAVTMMELLPPVGWADVATKRDLDQLRDQVMVAVHAEVNRLMRWGVTTLLSGVGLAFVAARFA